MKPPAKPSGRPGDKDDPAEPFVPDLSEGAETGVYLALLELLDEGLIITGDEVILDANSAACRLLGRDYRQVAGRPLAELFPSERAFLDARSRLFIAGDRRGVLPFALPDGSQRELGYMVAPRLRPGIHALVISPAGTAATTPSPRGRPAHPASAAMQPPPDARAMYLACHDILTGLPNRKLFESRFKDAAAHAVERRSSIGLLRIDIDNFEAANSEHGEDAGDALLQQVARRLSAAAGRNGLVAREHSDSFLALLPDIDLASEVGRRAEAMLAALALPFHAGSREIQLTASIGTALFPQDGRGLDSLLPNARQALDHARRMGGNNYQHCGAGARSSDHGHFETGLRLALERNQFAVHFQPLVDARSGRVRAGEALLRWQHPDLGLLPFRRFIAAVRDGELIRRIGDWVLQDACRQARDWPCGGADSPLVTVNVSVEQITHGNFPDRVGAALAAAGLAPERLELDLDEQVLEREGARLLDTLQAVAAMGVRLAIDDYGRGLSSIPRLRRYPVKAIKIDPALVRGVGKSEECEAIVEAIATMAGTLGLEVFARGVEDAAQQAFLCALDCHLQQGPLFGRPMPAPEFAAFVGKTSQ